MCNKCFSPILVVQGDSKLLSCQVERDPLSENAKARLIESRSRQSACDTTTVDELTRVRGKSVCLARVISLSDGEGRASFCGDTGAHEEFWAN